MAMRAIEAKIAALGHCLPAPWPPRATYLNCVRTGNLIFTAGHVCESAEGELITGKVGKDLSQEDGYKAAQRIALSILSTLNEELGGDLSHIKRVVKLNGFVNSTDSFTDQHLVLNGVSDLLVQILGEKGRHARTALATNTLPLNVAVEIEAVIEVDPAAPSKSAM